MATDIWLVKQADGSIRPMSEEDGDRLRRIKIGEPFKAAVTKPRNARHHRLGFHMLYWVWQNQDRYDTFEDFLVEIKLRTGHYQEHITSKGVVMYVPKSLKFEEMDEIEFGEWRNKAVNAILKYFMPGVDHPDFEAHVNKILSVA